MKMYSYGLLLVLVSLLQSAVQCEGDVPTKPPHYTIDLDVAPEERWKQIMLDYPNSPRDVDMFIRSIIPEELIPLVEVIAASLETYLPEPYAAEIRGITTHSKSSLGDVVLLNIFYDISASCTSIVASDEQGNIWHGRNLDYGFTNTLRNNTIAVDFVRNGKVVYSGVTFVGYVGLLTGQRPFAFTISLDQRATIRSSLAKLHSHLACIGMDRSLNSLSTNFQKTIQSNQRWKSVLVALLDRDATLVSFAIRDVLENSEDFQSAVIDLATQDTIASEYHIVGGLTGSDGVVITKGRMKAIDIWTLQPYTGRWFLVETNYDHWKPPPPSDNRRDPAIKAMNATGRSLTTDKLFDVMSTSPVLSRNTVYTTVMSASQPSLMQTWTRHVN